MAYKNDENLERPPKPTIAAPAPWATVLAEYVREGAWKPGDLLFVCFRSGQKIRPHVFFHDKLTE